MAFVAQFNANVVSGVVSAWKGVDTNEIRKQCDDLENQLSTVETELYGLAPEKPLERGSIACSLYPYTRYPSDIRCRMVERIVSTNDEFGLTQAKKDAAQLALRIRIAESTN